MKPIYKMKVIQIEVTNACVHSCSNCTRFCGHFKKPFFMDYDTFVKAVASMEGFEGMVGIMGGEPTIHPDFERLVKHYRTKVSPGVIYKNALKPIRSFAQYLIENDMQNIREKRGLWSSLGSAYYKHFELIQETFPFQLINDHSHSGLHQTLLVTRKELGIPDDKWIELRDNCWAQNLWSASITPKGCFFCEVAAALDMLFDGPGGWPIEKGWWKRRPEDFGEQLNWCEYCSAVLNVPRVEAALETDVVSPVIYEKLKALGSPKVSKNKVKIFSPEKYSKDNLECDYSSEWYLPSGDNTKRVSCTNRSLYPKKLEAVILSCDAARLSASGSLAQFDKFAVAETRAGIDDALKKLDFSDWVVLLDSGVSIAADFRKVFSEWIFNPGALYCYKAPAETDGLETSFYHEADAPLARQSGEHSLPYSFMLFNRNASVFAGPVSLSAALEKWPAEKIVLLESLKYSEDVQEKLKILGKAEKQKTLTMTAHILELWKNLAAAESSVALFGAGAHTKWLLAKLQEHKLPPPALIFDEDPDVVSLNGVAVCKPHDDAGKNISALVISSDTYSVEMTRKALQLWPDGRMKIINPYFGFQDPRFQK